MKSKENVEDASSDARERRLDQVVASDPLDVRVHAEIYRDVLEYIKVAGFKPKELMALLGMRPAEVSHLTTGRMARFTIRRLLRVAEKLDLKVRVSLRKPATRKRLKHETSRMARRRAFKPDKDGFWTTRKDKDQKG